MRTLLGLDIGGTNVKAVLRGVDGGRRRRARWRTAELGHDADSVIAGLETRIRALLERGGVGGGELAGLGLACAGLIDSELGQVMEAPNLRHWEGAPLGPWLEERFNCPVALENDVNALAYGEWRMGAGKGTENMVCLALGTGVGGGLILNGCLYRGRRGLAAELGHITIDRDGRRCPCGSRGCVEAYAGARAIEKSARRALARGRRGHAKLAKLLGGEPPTPRALHAAAGEGSGLARELFAEAGRALGVGIANCINAFAPERVVIAGGVSRAGELLFEPALQEIPAWLMNAEVQHVDVRPRALGDDGAALGAALLAVERGA